MKDNLINILYSIKNGDTLKHKLYCFFKKHLKYCYVDDKCNNLQQFDASITRLYHTIEKGLSYENYRPGFGEKNVQKLINILTEYSNRYDINTFSYETALSCLHNYVKKNQMYKYRNVLIENSINSLPGKPNMLGGTITFSPLSIMSIQRMNYKSLMEKRHSIRHFSNQPVETKKIIDALKIAQYTPSACNRQGWKSRIVINKECIKVILDNQNGNKGFGEEIDKILVITADLCAFQKNRELFQPYIDGGMYAESVLNALFFCGIGSIPLSASLLTSQEKKIRKNLKICDSEVFILFIGVGNYPNKCVTTRSERKDIDFQII